MSLLQDSQRPRFCMGIFLTLMAVFTNNIYTKIIYVKQQLHVDIHNKPNKPSIHSYCLKISSSHCFQILRMLQEKGPDPPSEYKSRTWVTA
jgi:hypothetical protein